MSDDCLEAFCEERAEWVHISDAGDSTPLCNDHALEFPNDQLHPNFHEGQ